MVEKSKPNIKIKPIANISSYKSTPAKNVSVKGKAGMYGLQGEADLGKGFSISGMLGKQFDKGKVNFPGGSESWNAKIPDEWNIQIKYSKKFGEKAKPDLSKFVDDKSTGGLIKGYPKLAKKGWK
jgi:hypothetical protein